MASASFLTTVMDGGRCIGAYCKSEREPCFSRCSFSVTLITLQPVSMGQEIAAGFASRGKSELHRARCRVTDLQGSIHAGRAFVKTP